MHDEVGHDQAGQAAGHGKDPYRQQASNEVSDHFNRRRAAGVGELRRGEGGNGPQGDEEGCRQGSSSMM